MSRKNIEDAYPLSPMQQGMLFHSLYSPESGVYVEQTTFDLGGELNISAFSQAWEQVISRHSVFRTALIWENLEQPIQVVGKQVTIPWQEEDWQSFSPIDQKEKLTTFLEADRQQDFILSKAPLMRLILIRLSKNSYYFVWSYHHLLLDGWSVPLIIKEVIAYYQAIRQGKNLYLPKPRPYRDYIAWLQQQDLSKSEIFWRKTLAGFTTPTPLRTGLVSQPWSEQKENYSLQTIHLSSTITTSLNTFVKQHQLTVNTLVQGAWALLLSRYSGEEDLVFGATVSGRPPTLTQSDSMVGLFINTLPVRVQCSSQQMIIPWLKQLLAEQIEAREYEYTPLLEIQKWSEIPSGLPLFESIVVFENYPVEASGENNLDLEIRNLGSFEKANYPLTLSIVLNSELSLRLEYNEDNRFNAAIIERMLKQLKTLLESMIVNPQQRVADLSLLSATEQQQLLVEWNNIPVEYPQDKCIHELLQTQVERTPDAIAVVFEDQQLSYQELNNRANQLAHYLQKLGITSEVLVGICVERSLDMTVAILATLKTGAAYLPLDPAYPKERLATILEDAQVKIVLTQQQLKSIFLEQELCVVCLDTEWAVIAQEPTHNCLSRANSENLAYVIYTSGSTGKPKGVAVAHQALVNYTLEIAKQFYLQKSDRVLQFASLGFDVVVEELFPTWITGAAVILQPSSHLISGSEFLELIKKHQLTVFELPTAYWHQWVSELSHSQTKVPACVRLTIVGGERISLERLTEWQKFHVPLVHVYGLTETTVTSTLYHLSSCSENPKILPELPIGRAIANTQIYLLDSELQPVPVEMPGEVYIGGVGLARGYLNRPEITAERFIPNPFSQEIGSRLYKTGDLARYLIDGNIEYIKRIDHQVKLRGFRIELGEIEAMLEQHSSVRETVVVLREDIPGNKTLVAYITTYSEKTLLNSELRSFLESKLPNYMIPSTFIILPKLPLTSNGKLDRKALPIPDWIYPELEEVFIAPQTIVEKQLVDIWMQVLGLKKIGVNDNFFELGGDSILSLQVIYKAKQVGIHLTPKQMFQHQTIAQLAVVSTSNEITDEQGLVTGLTPLTPIQHWFFAQNLLAAYHWNQSLLLEVKQPLDPVLLEEVVGLLLGHHDVLRLRFINNEIGFKAVISPPDNQIPLTHLDLSQLSYQAQEAALIAEADNIQVSLNLSQGPLLRIAYFDLGAERPSRLLLVIHHLVVDDVSWRILVEDFQTVYQQLSQGKKIQLPAKTTSFKHWSKRLQEYAQSLVLRSEFDYWRKVFSPEITLLPVDYPGGENTQMTAQNVSVSLSVQETQALLKDVPLAYRTQINDVLLTALVQTFTQWTGKSSLLIDLEGHGREELFEDIDLSRTVGWFTSIFPVLLNFEKATKPQENLLIIKEQLRNIPQRGIGYGLLYYLNNNLEITDHLHSQPKAEVLFNYLGQFDQVLSESSLFRLTQEYNSVECSQQNRRTHLFEVNASILQGRLQINWTYSEKLHRRTTTEALAKGFVEALRAIVAHCQFPDTGGFTPADFAEFQQSQWNQTDLDAIAAAIGGI